MNELDALLVHLKSSSISWLFARGERSPGSRVASLHLTPCQSIPNWIKHESGSNRLLQDSESQSQLLAHGSCTRCGQVSDIQSNDTSSDQVLSVPAQSTNPKREAQKTETVARTRDVQISTQLTHLAVSKLSSLETCQLNFLCCKKMYILK